jgi:prepilin-type N-terminal cleavage/methylation domain-containing protein
MRIGLVENSKKSETGFTLIELMIALAVFTIGLSAALALALANYNHSRDNLDKIIAANLAREGIELIKNVRDSNWLKIEANEEIAEGVPYTWDYGLTVLNGYVYIDYNDLEPVAFESACNDSIRDCVLACEDCDLYKDAKNHYTHGVTGALNKYSRAMFLERICVDEMGGDPESNESIVAMNSDCDDDTYIGIQIISHVQWDDNGIQYLEIVDKIYNWRR